MHNFKIFKMCLLFTLCSMISIQGFSEEGKKEGEGAAAGAQGLRSPEYNAKVAEINKLEAKVRDQQTRMKDLLQARAAIKDNAQNTAVMEEVTKIHKELNENIKAFNKASKELRYRFPDEGQITERRYIQLQEKSIVQIEEEIGLSTDLKRLRKKIDKKYKSFAPTEEEKLKEQKQKSVMIKPADATIEGEQAPEPKLRLVK